MNPKEDAHNKELELLLMQEKRTRLAMLSMLEDLQETQTIVKKAEREWTGAFDAIDDGVMLHDVKLNIMRANFAYKELCGAKKFKEIIGKPYWQVFPKLKGPMQSCSQSVESGKVAEEEFVLDDGRIFKSRTYPVYDDDGKYSFGIHLFEDITTLRTQELEIIALNKTLRIIGKCNEHLVRSMSEKMLLANICNEIVNSDEYEFSAIYLKDDSSINCSYVSSEIDTLSNIKEVDLTDAKYAECPVIVSIEQNRVIIINDIYNDSEWYTYMKEHAEICPATPYDMQGSMMILPLENSNSSIGALLIYSKRPNMFDDAKNNLFKELVDDTSYGIHTLRLRKKFAEVSIDNKEMLIQLQESLDGTIHSVAMMVEARDPYTTGHQNRVSDLAVAIAKKMELDEKRIEGLRLGALVHDIGKIKIPAEILSKPTKLTDLEYEMIKTHPQVGFDILKESKFPWPIAQMIYQHHEHIDGSGYPNGLKGEKILLEAKIISVADVVEAMASHRPYRAMLGIDSALKEIEKYKGIFYDTDTVDACISIFKNDEYKLTAQNSSK
ncbi:HD domain-containing protein [bacterium]|nr:HD domain-containing protein [bacterium]MBU1994174.1 HD domain-containing protein [bacterium]